jgi:hypothetical protein
MLSSVEWLAYYIGKYTLPLDSTSLTETLPAKEDDFPNILAQPLKFGSPTLKDPVH